MLPRASHAAHRTPGTGSPRASARASVALAAFGPDGRQSLRRVDADVWSVVRERRDERAYRRAGPLAQRAEGACRIACDHRILVSQCPSQCRLNGRCMGRQVNQFTDGAAPDGLRLMPKQVHQQRNGRRTDPLDDLKRHHVQVFMPQGRVIVSARAANATPLGPGRLSAVARTFGSLDGRRLAQSRNRASFLERLDSVGGSGDWDSATVWQRPAASVTASACFLMNDIT